MDTAITQPVFVCSKPSMESPEQFDLWNLFKVNRKGNITASLTASLLLTLNRFHKSL